MTSSNPITSHRYENVYNYWQILSMIFIQPDLHQSIPRVEDYYFLAVLKCIEPIKYLITFLVAFQSFVVISVNLPI